MAQGFIYGGNTILSHPIFVESILPFLLVFTIVFAILQKSKILGEKAKQIDAIVALVFGLLVISFGQATGLIIQLVPFLAVSLVVVLVLMLLIGSFNEGKDFNKTFPKGLRIALGMVSIIAVVIAVIYLTGVWNTLYSWVYRATDSSIFINGIFLIIIIGAVATVLVKGKSDKD